MFGLSLAPVFSANIANAEIPYTTFESIDGGIIDTNDWRGKPYLIVNTASKCGFTRQYAPLQKLYDRFHDQGLQMIAVPSDDFNQELDTDQEVKAFCELTYGIDMPMSVTTSVKGNQAHPFFKAIKRRSQDLFHLGTFNKVLIDSRWEPSCNMGIHDKSNVCKNNISHKSFVKLKFLLQTLNKKVGY